MPWSTHSEIRWSIKAEISRKPPIQRIDEGYRGNGLIPPTIEALFQILKEAQEAGRSATKGELVKLFGTETPEMGKFLFPFGGAYIILDIKGNTKIGRFLMKNCNIADLCECTLDDYGRGLCLFIRNLHSRQEKSIAEAAYTAALKIILSKLKIDGWVQSYYS